MTEEQLDKVDQLLTSLINNPKYGMVGLTLNDYVHASVGGQPMRDYSVREIVEDPDWSKDYDWYADADTEKAIEHNTFWSLFWYPDTPVGSYNSSAYDLALIVEQALNVNKTPGFDYNLFHEFDLFLRSQLKEPSHSLTLQFNDHKTYYQPTAERVGALALNTWARPEERERVVTTDRLWELYQVNPSQPLRGSSLASLFIASAV